MYKSPFRYVALSLACMLVLSGVASADEVPAADTPAVVEETAAPVDTPAVVEETAAPADTPAVVEEPAAPADTPAPETSVTPDAPPAPAAGFASALEPLFGPYTPRTQTVTVTHSDGTVEVTQEPIPGLAGLDWPWLSGVALFAVVLVCLFKLIGVVAKK